MVWRADDPQGYEADKVKWDIVQYTRGKGLDLGCGPKKTFPHFIGVDNGADEKMFGIPVRADVRVASCEKLDLFADESMDFVFSSHLLEHIKDFKAALHEWWRVIKVGGYLCLYLPHKDLYPRVGTEGANPDHKHDFSQHDIIDALDEWSWDLVENQTRAEGAEYSFLLVFRKQNHGKHTFPHLDARPEKTVGVVRYGAFGDLIQAASIFPALKKQGYHITLYTTPRGYEIVKADPHVDRIILQDDDQVPNHELGAFFENEKKKYTKWVNLCESVEGTLLAMPGRAVHFMPHNVRAKLMNVNYFEMTHDLAELPHKFAPKFYPTEAEKQWAQEERARIGGKQLIVYVLSGSAPHKVWPHMDQLFARILASYPDARIVTFGDNSTELLERGWENESRVVLKAGKYGIRESLALLDVADMVIGPETGVLNAAGHMPMPKIVFLSHSSRENLTKHWVNTMALTPKDVSCYPCHQMHADWTHCSRHPSGTALCQWNIDIDKAWNAVQRLLKKAA
jgi:ADP-heptose:LPS heptosyltransferase/predicted SAM-dependent methyltransferase